MFWRDWVAGLLLGTLTWIGHHKLFDESFLRDAATEAAFFMMSRLNTEKGGATILNRPIADSRTQKRCHIELPSSTQPSWCHGVMVSRCHYITK